MKKWKCTVCGYIHEGPEAPEKCPTCKVPAKLFEEVVGPMTLAAEHEYGVYAQTVKNNPNISDEDKAYIREQLFANFNGECSEVGMYLCMARIAHREGYPEIGLYWEKAAWEEAAADVGRKESPDYVAFAERVSDYALPTLFNTQLRRLG